MDSEVNSKKLVEVSQPEFQQNITTSSQQEFQPVTDFGLYASFWLRAAANILDSIILWLINFVVGFILILFLKDSGALISAPVNLFISLCYSIYFIGKSGQTPAKKFLGIRIVRIDGNEPVGYGTAFIRDVSKIISGIPFCLGFFWMIWDSKKQTWHDKIAKTIVIKV